MAGMMGSSSASPRLSPSAMSAICCRARAVSQQAKEEKIAPAKVVPRRTAGSELCWVVAAEVARPFGSFCREWREMGFFNGFGGLSIDGVLVAKHLALSTAMVGMVAAIVVLAVWLAQVMLLSFENVTKWR